MTSLIHTLVKAAPKVFVWVTFTHKHAAYIQVSKTAVYEYLSSLEEEDTSTDEFFVEIHDNGELYLGCPPPDEGH